MNTLKSLVAAVALTFALAAAAGGQTPPLCVPGQTETPPCPLAQTTSEEPAVVLGETQASPAPQSVALVSLVEFALQALLLA